jgi:HAD superfamily hydrolase (TIGR01509 family)
MDLDAIIFDVDGTIVDSVDAHAHAWQRALAHFGYEVPFERVRAQIGKGADQLVPTFVGEPELTQIYDDLTRYRDRLFRRVYLAGIRAFPGVRELFLRLLADGKRLALASSAKADELLHYQRLARIDDLIQTETSADDAERSKPAPDIFEAALARLGHPPPERVLVVGDSPYDAIGAAHANLRTLGLLCGGFGADVLREAGCVALYADPAHLLAAYVKLPSSVSSSASI